MSILNTSIQAKIGSREHDGASIGQEECLPQRGYSQKKQETSENVVTLVVNAKVFAKF